jgi:hypothetical protein
MNFRLFFRVFAWSVAVVAVAGQVSPAHADDEDILPNIITEARLGAPEPFPEPPTGWTLSLGQSFQQLGRTQLGTLWWLNADWGVGFDVGFQYGTREFEVVAPNAGSNLVRRVSWSAVPQVTGVYTLATAKTKRLLLALSAGPLFEKAEGQDTGIGYVVSAGPGIDWPLSTQLSLNFQERVVLVSDPDPARGVRVGLQPQISAYWWF